MKKAFPFIVLLLAVLGCANASRRTNETPAERPKITYSKPTFENAAGIYTLLHFEVTNTSSKRLEYIQIHASFYDKNGTLITSEAPYIERWQGLGPGERSTATVSTNADKRISNYELSFTANGDKAFEVVTLDATQSEPPSNGKKKKK